MPRIKLDIPRTFHFITRMDVRVSDINYGGHMGNDSLLGLMHEARIRFLKNWNCTEMNMFGVALIMSDVAVQYKAEAYLGDELQFEMTAYDFGVTGFDLFYYVTRPADQKVVAICKTNMVCFDYEAKKMKDVPEAFKNLFA